MTRGTWIALFLMGELVAALRLNDTDFQTLALWWGAGLRKASYGGDEA